MRFIPYCLNAFQEFIRLDTPLQPDVSCLLDFCIWLRDSKNLATNTIFNYKAAVGSSLSTVFGLDVSSWEFKALKDALFIERPPNPSRIPSWDIN